MWFEEEMATAFDEGRRTLQDNGIGAVVFAHKTTEGWEALLSGMIRGGWTVTGSWPIATEMTSRLRARESAALATSIHLICRPRPRDAPVGEWADVLRDLPGRVADWIERLQGEGVRGADLVFACVGPALEIFSRYSAVETPDGKTVGLPEYLERVWEVVGRTALEDILGTAEALARNGLAGVLEEDARLTALFLWALQSTQSAEVDEDDAVTKFSLPFDVVRRFAQPMGIDLDAWTDRVIGQQKGIVRLLPVTDRAKQLLGEDAGQIDTDWMAGDPTGGQQQTLFPDLVAEPGSRVRRRNRALLTDGLASPGDTTLDRVHPGYCNAAPIWPFCACAKAGRSELTFRKAKRRCRGAGMGFAGTEYRPNTERSRPWRRHGCEDRGGDLCGVAGPKDQAGTGGGIPWLSARSEARRRRRTGSPRRSWR